MPSPSPDMGPDLDRGTWPGWYTPPPTRSGPKTTGSIMVWRYYGMYMSYPPPCGQSGSCKPQFHIQFETSVSVSIHSVVVNPLCTGFCHPFSTITIACFTALYTVRWLIHCVLQVKISIFSLFSVLLWIKTFEIYLFLVDCYFHMYFSHVEATIIISSHSKKILKKPMCLSNLPHSDQVINQEIHSGLTATLCRKTETEVSNWNWNWHFKVTLDRHTPVKTVPSAILRMRAETMITPRIVAAIEIVDPFAVALSSIGYYYC